MSVLDTLNYGKLPKKSSCYDKVKYRRIFLKRSLKKRFEGTSSSKGPKWYEKVGDRYRGVLRYKNSVITFPNGDDCFYANTEEDVKQIYRDVYKEVDSGNFDEILEVHLLNLKRNRAKGGE